MPHNPMLKRVRAEYLEMPGLRLTVVPAQRLCGVKRTRGKMVLDALMDAMFLCMKLDGAYARLTEGDVPRRHPAKADLGRERRLVRAS